MKTFKYETQEQKNQLVKEFIRSSKSSEDFCKEKGISKSSLYRWKQEAQMTKEEPTLFLPLLPNQEIKGTSSKTPTSNKEIRLEIGNMTLYLTEQTSLSFFRQVLQEVKSIALPL